MSFIRDRRQKFLQFKFFYHSIIVSKIPQAESPYHNTKIPQINLLYLTNKTNHEIQTFNLKYFYRQISYCNKKRKNLFSFKILLFFTSRSCLVKVHKEATEFPKTQLFFSFKYISMFKYCNCYQNNSSKFLFNHHPWIERVCLYVFITVFRLSSLSVLFNFLDNFFFSNIIFFVKSFFSYIFGNFFHSISVKKDFFTTMCRVYNQS